MMRSRVASCGQQMLLKKVDCTPIPHHLPPPPEPTPLATVTFVPNNQTFVHIAGSVEATNYSALHKLPGRSLILFRSIVPQATDRTMQLRDVGLVIVAFLLPPLAVFIVRAAAV